MTDKQTRFVHEYMIDLNAKQAAVRAGYAPKWANDIAWKLLQLPQISEAVMQLKSKQLTQIDITAGRVLQEYAKIAFTDIRDFYDADGRLLQPHELSEAAAASLSAMETDEIWGAGINGKEQIGETKRIKLHNKLAALEALGKHLGVFEKDNKQKNLLLPVLVDWNGE